MPQILLPLPFVHFFGGLVVIVSDPVSEIVSEGPFVPVAVGVVHCALERCGWVEVAAFEPFASGKEQGLLHIYLYLKVRTGVSR